MKYSEIRRLISSGAVVECESAAQKLQVVLMLSNKLGFDLGVFRTKRSPAAIDNKYFPYVGAHSSGRLDGYAESYVIARHPLVMKAVDVLTAGDDMSNIKSLTDLLV